MSSIWTVLSKTKEYAPTVTQEELDSMGRGKPLDDVLRANAENEARFQERGWRDELEDLSRRLAGMPTVDVAEAALAALKAQAAAQIKAFEAALADCARARKTAFLSPLEQTHIGSKADETGFRLAEFKRRSGFQIRQAEARLADAREWNPRRERLQELRDRAKKIDAALAQV